MDITQKDNFTDVLDHVANNDSSNNDSSAQSGQVQGADGQVVTLGNEGGQNTSMDK
jgi:hypothetical protein